jgi:hypothetical protein
VSEEKVGLVSEQIEAGREFRLQIDAFWEACEQWADEELEREEPTAMTAVEKGGSKRASMRRSSGKSKRS